MKSALDKSCREPTRCMVQNNLYSLVCSILNFRMSSVQFSFSVSDSVFTVFLLIQCLKPKNSEPTKWNKYPCVCVCVCVCVCICVCVRLRPCGHTRVGMHIVGVGVDGWTSSVMNNQYWQISVIKNVIADLIKKDKFLCFVLSIRAAYESGFCRHRNAL